MIKPLISLAAALALVVPAIAQEEAEAAPNPNQIVDAASADEWIAIPAEDLLVMTLAPDEQGNPREVVIQLMPPPFSQGWVENIRTLAGAHWWDGLSVYRVVDNWVTQWGGGEGEEFVPPALPATIKTVPESRYTLPDVDIELSNIISTQGMRTDTYALVTGYYKGFPIAGDGEELWPTHCYASVGVARDLSPDTGSGAELYAVIGHAPRQLDRNIAVVGRVIDGIEHLSTLPRGTGDFGVYETREEDTPILSIRRANELSDQEQPRFHYLNPTSESFAHYAQVSANRDDAFYKVAAGGIDICNLKVPIRRVSGE